MKATVALALLASFAGVANGAVLGIDLGGQYIKASLVKPRVPLDVVINPEGGRRSPAIVGFFDGEQVFGNLALNQQSRRPKNFVSYVKMLIGKGADTPNLKWLNDTHYPHGWTVVNGTGTLQVRARDGSADSTAPARAYDPPWGKAARVPCGWRCAAARNGDGLADLTRRRAAGGAGRDWTGRGPRRVHRCGADGNAAHPPGAFAFPQLACCPRMGWPASPSPLTALQLAPHHGRRMRMATDGQQAP
jgi:hypothetical protein